MTNDYGTKKEMDALFSKGEEPWGQDWRASQAIRYEIYKKILKEQVFSKIRPPVRILDIGCSLGDFTFQLMMMNPGGITIGVDVSDIGIKMAKEKYPNMDFRVAGLPDIPIEEGNFDIITCLESIYYLPMEGRVLGLKRIKELLHQNGYLLISVPHWGHHKRYFTKEGFINFVSSEFEIILVMHNYGLLYYLFERPLFKWYWRFKSVARGEKWKSKLGCLQTVLAPFCMFGAKIIRFILSLKPPAYIAFFLAKTIMPRTGYTHTILLCRKKQPGLSK